MNIIALGHSIAGLILVGISLPLIKRKIKMNAIYGFRIDAAFASEQKWYDINAYGGRMFIRWGFAMIITGLIGISMPHKFWLAYAYLSLIIIFGGLIIAVRKTLQFAKKAAEFKKTGWN